MTKKEKLLKELKSQKVRLEVRKLRFKMWEDELSKKDEKGLATAKDIDKENMFWRKGRRLSDRIDFISAKIFELEKEESSIKLFRKLGGVI